MEKEESTMRKKFDEQFKAMVAMEAVKTERTLQKLTVKHQVHLNQCQGRFNPSVFVDKNSQILVQNKLIH